MYLYNGIYTDTYAKRKLVLGVYIQELSEAERCVSCPALWIREVPSPSATEHSYSYSRKSAS